MEYNDKYILFGAGIIGMAAFQYYGKETILAVIDNNPQKVGSIYEGIPIISFETYLEKYADKTIIINIYSKQYFECIEQLRKNGITNYFTSPPAIYGLESPEEFAKNHGLEKNKNVVFYGSNPITKRIDNYLKKNSNCTIRYIDNQLCDMKVDTDVIRIEDLKEKDTLVLTTNEMEKPIRSIINKKFLGKIADIYQYQEVRKEKYFYLEQYKDMYKGKRCFVIGNGPSLRKEDLMVLEKNQEISFAANGIFHMYDKVSWRPTHYMLCDALAYKIMYEDIKKIENKDAFIAEFCYTNLGEISKANRFYLINKLDDNKKFEFSDDIVKGVYSGKTVTYVMIQIACYMGVKEIYLLGVDWTGGKQSGVGRAEFYELSEEERVANNSPFNLVMEEKYAFESAREYANSHGIKIYNATRGGELEVFERVGFDSLFDR